jgi:putative ABC transport system permease protein
VEASLLKVLKTPVLLGRDFTADDDRPGAPLTALISHALWARRFGKNPDVVQRNISLDGNPVRIAGVLPPDFEMPVGKADILLPAQLAPLDSKGTATRFLWGIGRLKPGATVERARAVARTHLEGMLQLLSPYMREGATVVVRPLLDRQVGDAPRTAWPLLGAVATLLLIACVNVVNLLLARIESRRHEIAVRSAIGAGKLRLVRLTLTESLLLAAAGGALGLLIASLLLKLFIAIAPEGIPKINQASLDARVFIVAAALAFISGILVGLWPAAAVWRNNVLREPPQKAAVKSRTRFTLLTAQIALTIAMLGLSALFLKTLWKLTSVPLGFEAENVVTLSAAFNRAKYPNSNQQIRFLDTLMERARQLPGTVSAALSDAHPPLGILITLSSVAVDGHRFPEDKAGSEIRQHIVTPKYFDTFGITMLQGRTFDSADSRSAEPAAILSERAAKMLFPGRNPIGRRIRPQFIHPWYIVIGVVKDLRNMGLRSEPQPELYMVRRPGDWVSTLSVRSTMKPKAAAALLRQLAADMDPELPVEIQTLDQQIAGLSERPRFIAWLLTAFAAVALLLAASGLYGVLSYLVSKQAHEIGIRIALGARPVHVIGKLVGETAMWIAAGMLLGIPLAWIGGKTVQSQLFDMAFTDAISWSAAFLVLLIGLIVAILRPAVRAVRINPMDALRVE